jgi:uncharacterized protein (TIGR00106 family)
MSSEIQNPFDHVLADFSINPIGSGVNTTEYVVECLKILKKSNLKYNLHSNGTNIEGSFDQVVSAIRKCLEKLHQMGIPRCDTNVRFNTRTDKKVSMEDSIRVVTDKINAHSGA